MAKSIIIIGMGPGLSLGVAERFGKEGYTIGMVSRSADKLNHFQQQLQAKNIQSFYASADAADEIQLQKALHELMKQMEGVDVLLYNAVDYRTKNILEENIHDLTKGFKISIGNALVAVKELLPLLIAAKGAVLLTGGGAANYPNPDMGSISLGKAGIKNLAYQLNAALKSKAVYAGTVTVSGWIHHESATHTPKQIAEKFWELNQYRNEVEIVY
jgi:short-subunit dehydrogenase